MTATQVYWILVAGMGKSGQTTFLETASDRITYRDRRDMSLIRNEEYELARDALQNWSNRYLETGEEGNVSERAQIDRYQNSLLVGELAVGRGLNVCLYKPSPSRRFDGASELLEQGLLGAVMLVDSTAPETFNEASGLIQSIADSNIPFVIAMNKQGQPESIDAADLRLLLGVNEATVIPCDVTHRESIKRVLLELLELLEIGVK